LRIEAEEIVWNAIDEIPDHGAKAAIQQILMMLADDELPPGRRSQDCDYGGQVHGGWAALIPGGFLPFAPMEDEEGEYWRIFGPVWLPLPGSFDEF
jgi:hypothetical protein